MHFSGYSENLRILSSKNELYVGEMIFLSHLLLFALKIFFINSFCLPRRKFVNKISNNIQRDNEICQTIVIVCRWKERNFCFWLCSFVSFAKFMFFMFFFFLISFFLLFLNLFPLSLLYFYHWSALSPKIFAYRHSAAIYFIFFTLLFMISKINATAIFI